MDADVRQFLDYCPSYYLFNATYPSEVLADFRKELRNPFNTILAIMCLDAVIPFAINASYAYRSNFATERCPVEALTYSFAVHQFSMLFSWAPLRAAYTWMAVVLTFLRYRSLKSKGRFEASYTMVLSGCALAVIIAFAASVPNFMTTEIVYVPIEVACGSFLFDPSYSGTLIPLSTSTATLYDNECIMYRIVQWVSGVFHNALPAFLLLIFTLMLVFELMTARKGHLAVAGRSATKNNDAQRAAYMLIIVAILTLLSEIPQGSVCLVNSVFPIAFYVGYTQKFEPIWKTIQVFTTSCNLIITLAMSKQFRNAIIKTFCSWSSRSAPSRTVITSDRSITVQNEKY